ncbi:hypothetical protein KAR91_81130 [Candidatus Pacearchaeota archaeon]|nr:hypothetical protein [Candidatus Pacearchaeota archaeon]
MSEEITKTESTEAAVSEGSSDNLIASPEGSAAGELENTGTQTNEGATETKETVSKEQYEQLESKLGSQGQELGDYREFYKNVGPLLKELDKQPDLIEAIMAGKIDADLVQAAMDGKVTIQEAKEVSEAHTEVKKELGKKEYEKTSPEDINKLITDKVAEGLKDIKDDFNKNISEVEDMREYENRITDFMSNTDDFAEYSVNIDKWFQDHPEQDDIEVAYNAVKGAALVKLAEDNKSKDEAEANKDAAANAAGGGSPSNTIIEDENIVDKLISNTSNPNSF